MSSVSNSAPHVNSTTSQKDSRKQQQKEREENQTEMLREIAKDAEVFTDTDDKMYAWVKVNGHRETLPISLKDGKVGGKFVYWLRSEYAKRHNGNQPNGRILDTFVQGVVSQAMFNEDKREVFLRVGHKDGKVYLDLANEGQVVEIDEDGWRVLDDSPVMFRRSKGMLPLPRPVEGGKIDELKPFINATGNAFVLAVAWLLDTLHPNGPYLIQVLQGGQGAGKTSAIRYLRGIVDPNKAPTHRQPRDYSEMHIKAHNSWIVALDNMSSMPRALSDILCGMATGMGDGKRTHYENEDQTVFSAKRPVSVNGIADLATAGDLIDRAVIVHLDPIDKKNRRPEKVLDREYEKARPRIMGALLTAVSAALREQDNIQLEEAPRMADAATFVMAAEEALGWNKGTFMRAYESNQTDAAAVAVEANPVASTILKILGSEAAPDNFIYGTATTIKEQLESTYRNGETFKSLPVNWPKTPIKLSEELRRIEPALETQGVYIERITLHGNVKMIKISRKVFASGGDGYVSEGAYDTAYDTAPPRYKSRLTENGDDGVDNSRQFYSSFLADGREEENIKNMPGTYDTIATTPDEGAQEVYSSGVDSGDDTGCGYDTNEIPNCESDEEYSTILDD
jgi:putative DNA primase/helicase